MTTAVSGQYEFFSPADAFAIEVSLENTRLTRLPIYRNAITSLTTSGDMIIGGTSGSDGKSPFVFTASLSDREMKEVKDLEEIIPGQTAVRSGFARWKNRSFIAGTIPVKNGNGHIFIISFDENSKILIEDAGIPVPGEGILALAQKTEGNIVYGITCPSGQFFSYDFLNRKSKIYKEISPGAKELATLSHFSLKPESYLSRSIIMDNKGRIFGSKPVNKLFCFIPSTEKFIIYDSPIPYVWGREVLGMADSWTISDDGTIYCGNAGDGQLFELNPENGKTRNLGKPVMMPRMKGITTARDGKLWGIAGGEPGYSHLFSWDRDNGFHDYGNPEFIMKIENVERGILWRGFQLGSITTSEDGKYIIMGEEESLSQLMVFPVKKK